MWAYQPWWGAEALVSSPSIAVVVAGTRVVLPGVRGGCAACASGGGGGGRGGGGGGGGGGGECGGCGGGPVGLGQSSGRCQILSCFQRSMPKIR